MMSNRQTPKSAISSVRIITVTALLSAAAYALAFIEIPVPLSPPYNQKYAELDSFCDDKEHNQCVYYYGAPCPLCVL
mgnify:CR=1 FL=1